MKGLLVTSVLIGVMVMLILILNGELNPLGIELMKNTAESQTIIP